MVNINKVKTLAKNKGMKLSYICTALGYSNAYLTDVEKGKSKMSDDKIRALAAILITSYEYLTDQTDDPSPREDWIVEINDEYLHEFGGVGVNSENSSGSQPLNTTTETKVKTHPQIYAMGNFKPSSHKSLSNYQGIKSFNINKASDIEILTLKEDIIKLVMSIDDKKKLNSIKMMLEVM